MSIYTDIASEIYREKVGSIPSGVELKNFSTGDVDVSRVVISKAGLARPKGTYSVVDMPNFAYIDDKSERYISVVAAELSMLIPKKGLILVVGLGNSAVTADAIGPLACSKILVTGQFKNSQIQSDFSLRDVCAFTPGVMGRTGIDSVTAIKSMVRELKPSAVICIDSLYTSSPLRLGCTIQLTNAGISLGDKAEAINKEAVGCEVVAIGVPTLIQSSLAQEQKRLLVVTAKDIDCIVSKAANVISLAINRAVHTELSVGEISYLVS